MNSLQYAFAPAVAMSAAIVQAGIFYQAPETKTPVAERGRNIFLGVVPSTSSGSTVVYSISGAKSPVEAVDEEIAGFYATLVSAQSGMDKELESILLANLSSLYSRS